MKTTKSTLWQIVSTMGILATVCGLTISARAQLDPCENDKDCAKLFQPHKLVERKDVDKLDKTELQHFRDGVKAMMARPETDPLSWRYQAFIHGTYKTTKYSQARTAANIPAGFFSPGTEWRSITSSGL